MPNSIFKHARKYAYGGKDGETNTRTSVSELIASFLRRHCDGQAEEAWASDPERALQELVFSDREVATAAASNQFIARIRPHGNGSSVAHMIARYGSTEAKIQLAALPSSILDMRDEHGYTVWDLLSTSVSSSYV